MALNFPDAPSNGQKFIAANGVEYTYNQANDSWTGALEAGSTPINPTPNDVVVTPDFGNPAGTDPGSGTLSDPYILTTANVLTVGGTAQSDQYITITAGKPGDQVLFTNNTTPTGIAPKFNQPVESIDANGKWSGYIDYNDALGDTSAADGTYVGKLQLGSVYFQWSVNQSVTASLSVDTESVSTAVTQPTTTPSGNSLSATQPVVSGGTVPFTYAYLWEQSSDNTSYVSSNFNTNTLDLDSTVSGSFWRCVVTVTDSGSFSQQSITSTTNSINTVEIVSEIDITAPEVDNVLGVSSIITGNKTGYTNSTYQWSRKLGSGGGIAPIDGATNETYTVLSNDLGYELSCAVTATSADANQGDITATSPFTSAVISSIVEPDITSVTLTEADATDGDRFTSSLFPYTLDMATVGNPDPTYAVKAKLTGATFDFGVKSSTITGVADTVIPGGWTGVSIPTATWRGVTYGANTFVAVSSSGTAIYSADGITWLNSSMPSGTGQEKYYSVAYGNGKFVAVSSSADPNNAVISSTNNGQTWSAGSSSTGGSIPDQSWNSVVYGGDKFVAVSANGSYRIMYSTSGTSWTTIASPLNVTYRSIAYGGGKFVAITDGSSDQVTYSSNGINWDILSVSGVSNLSSITYGDGKFVAVGNGGSGARAMSSTDGINWTALTVPAQAWNSVTYGDGKFLAVGNNNDTDVMYSTDLTNWTLGSASEHNSWNSVVYGGDKFVAISRDGTNRAMWSLTGVNEVKATALTCASNSNLDKLNTEGGAVFMTDGDTALDGSFAIASYQPTSSAITSATEINIDGAWTEAQYADGYVDTQAPYLVTYEGITLGGINGNNGPAQYSTDGGITFNTCQGSNPQVNNLGTLPVAGKLRSASNKYWLVCSNGQWVGSSDCALFSSNTTKTVANINTVAVGGVTGSEFLLAVLGSGAVIGSIDGTTWKDPDQIGIGNRVTSTSGGYQNLFYVNGAWFVSKDYIGFYRSTDNLQTWQSIWATPASEGSARFLFYSAGDKIYGLKTSAGNQAATQAISYVVSTDNGNSFTNVSNDNIGYEGSVSVVFAEGNYKMFGIKYTAQQSTSVSSDGINWSVPVQPEGVTLSLQPPGMLYDDVNDKYITYNGQGRRYWSSITGTGVNVNEANLTFADPCTDLQYFKVGDTVSADEGNALYAAQSAAFSTTLIRAISKKTVRLLPVLTTPTRL